MKYTKIYAYFKDGRIKIDTKELSGINLLFAEKFNNGKTFIIICKELGISREQGDKIFKFLGIDKI